MLKIIIFIIFNPTLIVLIAAQAANKKIVAPPKFQPKIYAVSALVKVNWYNALEICGYHGMTLAAIQSEQEKDLLTIHLKENGFSKSSEHFWVGGSDLGRRYTWVWISNGRPFGYTNWAKGEPNNKGGDERCVTMHSSGYWNDFKCLNTYYFICESRGCMQGDKYKLMNL